jgi:hypothetical protein
VSTEPTSALCADAPSGQVGVTVLVVSDHALAQRLIGRWFEGRSAAERWALLLDSTSATSVQSQLSAPTGLSRHELSAGCICCVGALGLRVGLSRLLREQSLERVFVVPSEAARIAPLVDALRSSLAAGLLSVDSIIAVGGAARTGPAGAFAERPSWAVVDGVALAIVADGQDPPPCSPDWPQVPTLGESACADWADVLRQQAGHSGSEVVQHQPILLRFTGETVFDRLRILAQLREFAQRNPHLLVLAVFRTTREWYRWQSDAPGELHVSRWRLDSRVKCVPASMDLSDQTSSWLTVTREQLRVSLCSARLID